MTAGQEFRVGLLAAVAAAIIGGNSNPGAVRDLATLTFLIGVGYAVHGAYKWIKARRTRPPGPGDPFDYKKQ